jgi:general secretion pathway protein K
MVRALKTERGTALVLTLLIIITLAGLALGFSGESGVELTLAGYMRDQAKAYEVARSAINVALWELASKGEEFDLDAFNEEWRRTGSLPAEGANGKEGVRFLGGIVDESGKININLLRNEEGEIDERREMQLRRLFIALGLKEELLNPLLDWLDADDIERQDGAEGYYYQSLDEPYECANGPFLTIGQLFLVRGMREIERFGEKKEKRLLDYLTIYSDGKININTAPREVIESLSEEMDSAQAAEIVAYRKEEKFKSIDDLRKVPGLDEVDDHLIAEIRGWITVKMSTVSFESNVDCNGAIARIKAIAKRDQDKASLIYWQVH